MEFNTSINRLQKTLRSLHNKGILNSDLSLSMEEIITVFDAFPADHRSMIYYMVLNSDEILTHKTQLLDSNVGLFMGGVSPISLNWLIHLLCNLNKTDFLLEVIQFTPKIISDDILKFMISNFSNINNSLTIRSIVSYNATHSCNITDYIDIIDKYATDIKELLLTDNFKRCAEELLDFLRLCMESLCKHENKERNLFEFYSYSCNYTSGQENDMELSNLLLQKLLGILSMITCDVWILWVDFHLPSDETLTMQFVLGKEIEKLKDKINQLNYDSNSDLVQCLSALTLKPKTISEELSEKDITSLTHMLETEPEDNLPLYYEHLVNRGLFDQEDFVNTCLRFIKLSTNIVDIVKQCLVACNNPTLIVETFQNITHAEQKYLVEYIADNGMLNKFYSDERDGEIREMFNKCTYVEWKLPDNFYQLVLTNPFLVIVSIIHWCCQDMQATNILRYIDKLIFAYDLERDNHLITCAVKSIVEDEMDNTKFDNLKKVLIKLHNEKYIPDSMVTDAILKVLSNEIFSENWKKVIHLLEFILLAVQNNMSYNAAALSAYLANVMKVAEFDYFSYSADKLLIQQYCQQLVANMTTNLDEKSRKWLRQTVSSMPSNVLSYFYNVWVEDELQLPKRSNKIEYSIYILCASNGSLDALSSYMNSISQKARQSFSVFLLVKTLPKFHINQWQIVFNWLVKVNFDNNQNSCVYLSAIRSLSDVLRVLGHVTSANISTFPCFQNCLRTFGNIALRAFDFRATFQMFDDILFNLLTPLSALNSRDLQGRSMETLLPVLLEIIAEFEKRLHADDWSKSNIYPFAADYLKENLLFDFFCKVISLRECV